MIDGGLLFLVGTLSAVAGGVVWGVFFSHDSKIHRRLFAAPIETVAAAVPGRLVRLTGVVEPGGQVLTAPITRRRGVHYKTVVHEKRRTYHGTRWVEAHRFERSVDFLLRDATGVARVHVDRCQVAVVRHHNSRSGLLDWPTAMELDFLERQGEPDSNGRRLRYAEGAIEFGETVTVLGIASAGDGEVGLHLHAPPDDHLLVTDEPTTVRSVARGAR